MTVTVLITSVGSLVGRAVLDALEGRRDAVRIVGCSSAQDAPDLARCDAVRVIPPTLSADWAAAVDAVLADERPDAVVPGRDLDVQELARLAIDRPDLAAVLLAGPAPLARTFHDKAATAAFARRHGLPHAPTVSTDAEDAGTRIGALLTDRGLPLIAKPADGSGSRGVRILTEAAQVARAVATPGLVVQPLLDPPDERMLRPDLADGTPLFWEVPEDRLFAVQTAIGRDGTVLGSLAHGARMVRGRPEELWACDEPGLSALAAGFVRAAVEEGWRGPLNVQAKRDRDGSFLAIEVNGRFAGGTSGRLLLGLDEVGLLLDDLIGRPVIPARTAAPVRRVVRLLTDVAVTVAGPADRAAPTVGGE